CCCLGSTWFRCFTCRTSGWRAGPRSRIRPRPRCSASCRRPGGGPRRRSDRTERTIVILGEPPTEPATTTLDGVFRRTASRKPEALALIDPANRETFTDGAPRRLTYAEADRAVSA